MFGLGTTEIIILLVIVVLLFGAKRIPKLAKAMGQSVRAFRAGSDEVNSDNQLVRRED